MYSSTRTICCYEQLRVLGILYWRELPVLGQTQAGPRAQGSVGRGLSPRVVRPQALIEGVNARSSMSRSWVGALFR